MGVVKGFRAIGGGTPPASNKIILNVTLANANNPSMIFADMKYNKRTGIILVSDDGYASDYNTIFAVLHGGISAINGQTYPGIRGTDGCGNPVEWHMSWALTGTSRDTHGGFDITTWDEYLNTISAGYGFSNHTKDHSGYDKYYEVKENEKYIFEKTGERTRCLVIPTADEGYAASAPSNSLRYKMVGSQFGVDSPDDYTNIIYWNGRVDVKTITNTTLDRFLFGRNFYLTWGENDRMGIRAALIDPTLNGSTGTAKLMGHIGMHGAEIEPFVTEMNYIKNHPNGGDNLWMPTMQEFIEYYESKLNAVKTETVNGSILTVEIDISNLPEEGKLRDFSLILQGANISSVTQTGADRITFNSSTGLINVFKKNTTIKNPYAEQTLGQTPPQIIEVQRIGYTINLLYDKPLTQNQFSNSNGNAYSVSNNTVVNITGSGANWTINCQNVINSGQFFSYRMQRGNAQGLDGLKVCSYIDFPIP